MDMMLSFVQSSAAGILFFLLGVLMTLATLFMGNLLTFITEGSTVSRELYERERAIAERRQGLLREIYYIRPAREALPLPVAEKVLAEFREWK